MTGNSTDKFSTKALEVTMNNGKTEPSKEKRNLKHKTN
jgi:hypothetical protein